MNRLALLERPSHVLADSLTMLRRQLIHIQRYPIVLFTIGIPVILLLLFVGVFGGTMGAGLPGVKLAGRAAYLAYLVPGISIVAVMTGAQMTAIGVSMDMTEGIIARFRTMSISRSAVLAAHVISSVIQTMASVAAVIGAAMLLGYRPQADLAEWLGAAGLLALVTYAITWLCVGMGLVTKSVETASNLPMPLMLLPFLGSGFVPTASLPVGLRWFAENQPFTPIMEAVRGLLAGQALGSTGWVAVAWCVAIALVGHAWSRWLYERERVERG